jgi:hypothetical protein
MHKHIYALVVSLLCSTMAHSIKAATLSLTWQNEHLLNIRRVNSANGVEYTALTAKDCDGRTYIKLYKALKLRHEGKCQSCERELNFRARENSECEAYELDFNKNIETQKVMQEKMNLVQSQETARTMFNVLETAFEKHKNKLIADIATTQPLTDEQKKYFNGDCVLLSMYNNGQFLIS